MIPRLEIQSDVSAEIPTVQVNSKSLPILNIIHFALPQLIKGKRRYFSTAAKQAGESTSKWKFMLEAIDETVAWLVDYILRWCGPSHRKGISRKLRAQQILFPFYVTERMAVCYDIYLDTSLPSR
ncbi:hypothetical protein, variant [Blastomyces dermatitidis ATCC 18188]|uniref:Uncharacterized protein n=1 Tax=Ajellomyces dermatitidis (strain ATCC 18188 / CBS 674.68) TaxID=653446 RepID=F2TET3_AJEDA|nr:hypothetical protein BDDG_04661 [Blastomyces dermatitidis ATCC 18188]KMW67587.1 hypothetical protein, variant [Blastomyces dermatitidis ATCC 18188]